MVPLTKAQEQRAREYYENLMAQMREDQTSRPLEGKWENSKDMVDKQSENGQTIFSPRKTRSARKKSETIVKSAQRLQANSDIIKLTSTVDNTPRRITRASMTKNQIVALPSPPVNKEMQRSLKKRETPSGMKNDHSFNMGANDQNIIQKKPRLIEKCASNKNEVKKNGKEQTKSQPLVAKKQEVLFEISNLPILSKQDNTIIANGLVQHRIRQCEEAFTEQRRFPGSHETIPGPYSSQTKNSKALPLSQALTSKVQDIVTIRDCDEVEEWNNSEPGLHHDPRHPFVPTLGRLLLSIIVVVASLWFPLCLQMTRDTTAPMMSITSGNTLHSCRYNKWYEQTVHTSNETTCELSPTAELTLQLLLHELIFWKTPPQAWIDHVPMFAVASLVADFPVWDADMLQAFLEMKNSKYQFVTVTNNKGSLLLGLK